MPLQEIAKEISVTVESVIDIRKRKIIYASLSKEDLDKVLYVYDKRSGMYRHDTDFSSRCFGAVVQFGYNKYIDKYGNAETVLNEIKVFPKYYSYEANRPILGSPLEIVDLMDTYYGDEIQNTRVHQDIKLKIEYSAYI